MKIMFVCHGNICRSPMAEFIFKDMAERSGMDIEVSSSATSYEEIGNDMHYGTKKALDKHNIKYHKRQAVRLTKSDYKKYDYILAMDSRNIRNIMSIIGSDPQNKVHLLMEYSKSTRDIFDPWYTGDFEKTYEDIQKGCEGFLKYILQ